MTMKVAFLGPAGTFTEAALGELTAGSDVEPVAVDSPHAACALVRAGGAERACVAIENSVDGAVTATFDAVVEGSPLQIYREVDIPVVFSIVTRPGVELAACRTFSTHPVAYQQVRGWLRENLPGADFQPASSNAAAAQAVAAGDVDCAAVPARAAELFGLRTHAAGVADVTGAATRFVLVGPPGRPAPRTGHDRTSVIFTLPNQPGTLVGALQEFAHRGVDMTRIESRPTRRKMGTYRFYVDLYGHIDDRPVAEALRALWLRCEEIVFLGSWPAGQADAPAPTMPDLAAADAWVRALQTGE